MTLKSAISVLKRARPLHKWQFEPGSLEYKDQIETGFGHEGSLADSWRADRNLRKSARKVLRKNGRVVG